MMPIPTLWSKARIGRRLNSERGVIVVRWHCGGWFRDSADGLRPMALAERIGCRVSPGIEAPRNVAAFGERCEHRTRAEARECPLGALARAVWWRSAPRSGGGPCAHFHASFHAALRCAEQRIGHASYGDVIAVLPSSPGEARAESVQMRAEAKGGREIGR